MEICKDVLWCEIPQWEITVQSPHVRDEFCLSRFSVDSNDCVSLLQVLTDSLYFTYLIVCLCDFAGVHLLLPHTRLTLHVAAPPYLTVAGQAGETHGCVVTASATQTLTAGVFGTWPAACTWGVAGGSAEAGRVFQEDQISSSGALAMTTGPCEFCLSGGCVGDTHHSHCSVISKL